MNAPNGPPMQTHEDARDRRDGLTPTPRCRCNFTRVLRVVLAVCVLAFGVWLWCCWELIPGTYHRDASGRPRGTGTESYTYDNGRLMLKEWYRAGLIERATWFRPDGTEITTEHYDKATGGVGYYLRQDGAIKSKYTYSYSPSENLYVADGDATYFRPDGAVEKTVRFSNGVEVKP